MTGQAGVRGARFPWILPALMSALAWAGADGANSVDKSPHAAAVPSDPYLWLEDIHGARALEWVRSQNQITFDSLKSDAEYTQDYQVLLSMLDADDRIVAVVLIAGHDAVDALPHLAQFDLFGPHHHPRPAGRSARR